MVGNDILMWHRINQEMTLIPLPWAEQGTRWAWIPKGSVFQLKTRSAGTNFWEQDVDFGAGHPMVRRDQCPISKPGVLGPVFGSRMLILEQMFGNQLFCGQGAAPDTFPFQQGSLGSFFLWRGISSCGQEFLPVVFFWNQCFDCLLWFHTVWIPARCNLALTASCTLVRFPAKQLLQTSLNAFFRLRVKQKILPALTVRLMAQIPLFIRDFPVVFFF